MRHYKLFIPHKKVTPLSLIIIQPHPEQEWASIRMENVLRTALAVVTHRTVRTAEELSNLEGEKLLFAVALGDTGVNLEYMRILARLRREPELLRGCTAGLIVDANSPLYTKSTAAELTFAANLAGCSFLGRPLVEATDTLSNFNIQAKNLGTDRTGAYHAAARELVERLESEVFPNQEKPELLVLHASSHATSNTIALWKKTREKLEDSFTFTAIGLRNGTLSDCSGCPYTVCLHFGEKESCFYGGVMAAEVFPAVRRCSGVVLLCPNFYDAISANMTAFINRLTALFRQTRFYDKALFALVVSGYSGGDILARQLISGMNMNKSFYLPGNFALLETANDPGQALRQPGIERKIDAFAQTIRTTLLKNGM